jgi:hypothetical protein
VVEVVDQIDKEFTPYVKPVRVGSSVQFPNKDNVQHHVYSFSAPKKFELPLYRGTPARPVLFDRTGVVKLGCNIHDWMVGYIYVAETPHFATTGAQGTALIRDLPAGSYSVRLWHPRLSADEHTTQRRAQLAASGAAELAWMLVLKAEERVRRAPAPGRGGRY